MARLLLPTTLLLPVLLLLGGAPRVRAEEGDAAPVELALADVTEAAGLDGVRGDRFSFGDFDGDGDPDLLVGGTRLLRNVTEAFGETGARIAYEDVTASSGIAGGPGGGGVWVDLDRDGDLDVVTPRGALKVQHAPGRFRDEAEARGVVLEHPMAVVGAGDLDGDGWVDLLFGGGEDWNEGDPTYFPRRLFRGLGEGRFEDATPPALEEGRYGRAVALADFDQDGDLDAYLGNYRLQPNELLVNASEALDGLVDRAQALGVQGRRTDDRGTIPGTGQRVGLHYGHTIAASWGDLDADGDLDLWVSNLVHKFVGEHPDFPGGFDYRGWLCDDSAIYRNEGEPDWTFEDVRASSGIPLRPVGDRGVFRGDELWSNAAIVDLDLDGLPEVLVTQVYQLPYSHTLLFRNRGGLRFEEVGEAAGVRRFGGYGAASADVDGDGDDDLVVGGRPSPTGEQGVRLFRNDTAPAPWIAFRLVGPGGDPMPVGAQVVATLADGGSMVRQVAGAMGSHSQQDEALLRFGLRGREATGFRVRWLGGEEQDLGQPAPGQVHEITPTAPR